MNQYQNNNNQHQLPHGFFFNGNDNHNEPVTASWLSQRSSGSQFEQSPNPLTTTTPSPKMQFPNSQRNEFGFSVTNTDHKVWSLDPVQVLREKMDLIGDQGASSYHNEEPQSNNHLAGSISVFPNQLQQIAPGQSQLEGGKRILPDGVIVNGPNNKAKQHPHGMFIGSSPQRFTRSEMPSYLIYYI